MIDHKNILNEKLDGIKMLRYRDVALNSLHGIKKILIKNHRNSQNETQSKSRNKKRKSQII